MANPATTGNDAVDGRIQAYYDEIDALTGLALAGEVDENEFRDELERLTLLALLLMFVLSGGDPNAPGAEEALEEQRQQARDSAGVIATALFNGNYSTRSEDDAVRGYPAQTAEEGREKLRFRLILWTFFLSGVYHIGQAYIPPKVGAGGELIEATGTWRFTPGKDHCTDCLFLNGVTLTWSEWQWLGIHPQSYDLECGGLRCGCQRSDEGLPSDGLENLGI